VCRQVRGQIASAAPKKEYGVKISRKLCLVFGIQVLLTTVLGISVLFGFAEGRRQFGFVAEHHAHVIANAKHLAKLVVDMETGQRGFIITGKEEFLEPYRSGGKEFDVLLEKEKKLVSDSPRHVAALERIEHLVYEWKNKAARPEIAMARKAATHAADVQDLRDILGRGVGKKLINRFMALAHEIEVSFSDHGDWEGAFAVKTIQKCMADREGSQRDFLITGKEESLENYTAGEQKKLPERFATLRAIISERGRDDGLSKRVDQLEQLAREWTEKAAEPEIIARRQMERHPETLEDVAALLQAGTGKNILDQIRAELANFTQVQERLATQRYVTATQTFLSAKSTALFLIVCSAIFGLATATFFIRMMSGSIGKLVTGAEIVASGDLEYRSDIESKDEFGNLAKAFNQMVTSRQQAEEELRQAELEAQAASEAKSQFLANMSHEIRTPMSAIIGFADLLADDDLTDGQRANVNIIREAGHGLLDLINDILDFSKIQAKQLEVEMIECSLGRILSFIESTMKLMAEKKALDFEIVECDGLPERIRTDPTRLRQCLINLASNAVKFTEEGHVYVNLSLESRDNRPYIRFDVEDTGVGIPVDKQRAIFEAFVQADGSHGRQYGGTGLGLAVTKQLAELLGGELTITSEVGRGSVFSLVIPAGLDVTRQSGLDIHATHVYPHKVETGQSEFSGHVLVAEDVETNQILVKSLLERMGIEVTIAADGSEALHKVLIQQFDLILMDIHMPRMNGYEAAKAIRKEGVYTPIIALTANAMAGDDKKCLEAGCDDYLTKPIDRQQLRKKVRKYLPSEKTLHEKNDSVKSPAGELAEMSSEQISYDGQSGEPTSASEEIFNWKWLVDLLGDEESIQEIIPVYLNENKARFDELAKAIEASDAEAIKLHAHAIKGAGQNLGATRMYDIAYRIECAGRENEVKAAAQLFEVLNAEFDQVVSFFSRADWMEIAKQEKVITVEKLRAYPTCGG